MINFPNQDLFWKDNIKKNLILDFSDFQITNEKIYQEQFEISETLCSQSELRFGCCEASLLKAKIRNEFGELKDKWFDATIELNAESPIPFKFGRYKVYTSKPSADKKFCNITAYDAMYDIINADITQWYNGLTFPLTLKEFRDSFFDYLGILQEDTVLVQDEMLVEKTIEAETISGKEIIVAICELNGRFGHITRQNTFKYVELSKKLQYLHPSNDLYPSENIYPGMMFDLEYEKYEIPSNKYSSCEYEDFITRNISKLQIRQEANDIGAIQGSGTNAYVIENNFLTYGKSANEMKHICRRLFVEICGVVYRPFRATLPSNPCFEVGDTVVVNAKYKTVESYLLERRITGIQMLFDSFEAKGTYEYQEKVNSANKQIKRLIGKTNVLERTVEKMSNTIYDEKTGLQTKIEQTSEKVEAKVSKGDVSAQLSIELGKIFLKGNRLVIESDNLIVDESGHVQIKGRFEAETPDGMKSVEINNNVVRFFSWANDGDEVGRVGSVYSQSTDTDTLAVGCMQDDELALGYTNGDTFTSMMRFDPSSSGTPYIINTASGTLFPENKNGGIVIENGLIKSWDLHLVGNSTLNVISGISTNSDGTIKSVTVSKVEVRSGMIQSWSNQTITA